MDHTLRNDLVPKIALTRPQADQTLEEWALKVFEGGKFGLVFNSLEEYDNELAVIMSSITAPLIKTAGLPLGGLSFLFFMGNYGFTPFGIHKESKGEEGFLFHLGPGKKEFYAWDDEELNKIEYFTKVFHDEIDEMLPSSKKYLLTSGSAMFIPNQVYHIANTTEFSLSVVMDYINPSMDTLEKELAKAIASSKYTSVNINPYLSPVQLEDKQSSQILNSDSIMSQFKRAFDRRLLRLKSNGGILKKSITNRKSRVPNGLFSISSKKSFPILLHETASKDVIVFARGHEISMKPHPQLQYVIDQLNSTNGISFTQLQGLLLPKWDMVDIYSLISKLLVAEAVEVSEPGF